MNIPLLLSSNVESFEPITSKIQFTFWFIILGVILDIGITIAIIFLIVKLVKHLKNKP